MQISISFTMSDIHQQAGLLLAYMQVQQFQNAADAVHIILGRRRRRRAQTSTSRTNIQLMKTSFCCANERLQHAISAVRTPWKGSACIVSAMKAQWKLPESAENRQQELRRNAIEYRASSVAMPWLLSGCHDRPFFMKNFRVFLRSHGAPEN